MNKEKYKQFYSLTRGLKYIIGINHNKNMFDQTELASHFYEPMTLLIKEIKRLCEVSGNIENELQSKSYEEVSSVIKQFIMDCRKLGVISSGCKSMIMIDKLTDDAIRLYDIFKEYIDKEDQA